MIAARMERILILSNLIVVEPERGGANSTSHQLICYKTMTPTEEKINILLLKRQGIDAQLHDLNEKRNDINLELSELQRQQQREEAETDE